jgi:hypothetical protein
MPDVPHLAQECLVVQSVEFVPQHQRSPRLIAPIGLPKQQSHPAVGFGVLVIFKRKNPGPHQSIASFNNTSQDIKHCLGLTTDSLLALVVKGTVEAAQIDI